MQTLWSLSSPHHLIRSMAQWLGTQRMKERGWKSARSCTTIQTHWSFQSNLVMMMAEAKATLACPLCSVKAWRMRLLLGIPLIHLGVMVKQALLKTCWHLSFVYSLLFYHLLSVNVTQQWPFAWFIAERLLIPKKVTTTCKPTSYDLWQWVTVQGHIISLQLALPDSWQPGSCSLSIKWTKTDWNREEQPGLA